MPLQCFCCCLVTKLCPTLCDSMSYSLPGSSVHGISQARILEWVAVSFSRGIFLTQDRTWVSCIAGRFFISWATSESHSTGDPCSVLGLGRSPGEGNGNPLQYSCLENPMRRAWWATIHGVAKSRTRLSDYLNWYGKRVWKKRVDICICITDSLCCTAETNTTVQINYISIIKNYTFPN